MVSVGGRGLGGLARGFERGGQEGVEDSRGKGS